MTTFHYTHLNIYMHKSIHVHDVQSCNDEENFPKELIIIGTINDQRKTLSWANFMPYLQEVASMCKLRYNVALTIE